MENVKKVLFTDTATATGGRSGHVTSKDNVLDFDIKMPIADDFEEGKYSNPEQLFAAAYASCFDGAINAVAQNENISLEGTETTVHVDFGKTSGGFGIGAKIESKIDGVSKEKAQELLDKAHQVCPYSKATRGNIDVTVQLK